MTRHTSIRRSRAESSWAEPLLDDDIDDSKWYTFTMPKCTMLILIITTVVVTTFAAWLPGYIRDEIDSAIDDFVILDEEDDDGGFSSWESNTDEDDAERFHSIYYFHIMNPEEMLQGETPVVQEIGPWAYRSYNIKHDWFWNEDKSEIEFYEQKYFVFDPDNSFPGASEDDVVTTWDLSLFGLKWGLVAELGWGVASKQLMTSLMDAAGYETPFVTRSVKELVYGYFDDPILTAAAAVLGQFDMELDSRYPGIFSNFSTYEETVRRRGPSRMYTGKGNMLHAREMIKWENMTLLNVCPSAPPLENDTNPDTGERMIASCPVFQHEWTEEEAWAHGYYPIWATDHANGIRGTDVNQFHRDFNEDAVEVFIDDIYRSATLERQFTYDFKGVKIHRYQIPDWEMYNSSCNPDNNDYYSWGPSGFLNFSTVAGMPLFASKPHWFDASPHILEEVRGLKPNRHLHEVEIDIEPRLGTVVRGRKRLQLSTYIDDWEIASLGWNYVPGLLPLFFADEHGEMTDDDADQIIEDLYDNEDLADAIELWGWIAAGVLMAVTIFVGVRVVRHNERLEAELPELI
eukprot:Rmarinus@m.23516